LEQTIWQAWLLVFLPPKLSVVLKINILHQSKNYKNHFENSNFWGMWPLGHVGHVTYSCFINMLDPVGQIYCMVVTCLDVCIIYFISCACIMNSSLSYTIY
jgi:hypothetical protein